MKYILPVTIVLVFIGLIFLFKKTKDTSPKADPNAIRYVAIGDSYTIGEGVPQQQTWPALLTKHLQEKGINISLVANPSITGWTTQQAIEQELPIYDASNPQFATLLIGVNDWVQGVDRETFRKNLVILLDHMQAKLVKKDNLLVVTIPDFSATPTGKQYANGRDITAGIADFNAIIKKESQKRKLKVVDIYPISQQMEGHPELINADGLHPAAAEYALWEGLILPEASSLLQ